MGGVRDEGSKLEMLRAGSEMNWGRAGRRVSPEVPSHQD